jgi:hypothetical protein
MRFTGYFRFVGAEYGTFITSPFWRLDFGGALQAFGKYVILISTFS